MKKNKKTLIDLLSCFSIHFTIYNIKKRLLFIKENKNVLSESDMFDFFRDLDYISEVIENECN